jgi:four helix bundle protein
MAPRHFTELQCWQLADRLRAEAIAICETPAAAKHCKFCDSFVDAAGSACRNIAEGFKRFRSPQIVMFFDYAIASLAEVQDHLCECFARKFVSKEEFDRLWDLSEHATATAIKFRKPHLEKVERTRQTRTRGATAAGGRKRT